MVYCRLGCSVRHGSSERRVNWVSKVKVSIQLMYVPELNHLQIGMMIDGATFARSCHVESNSRASMARPLSPFVQLYSSFDHLRRRARFGLRWNALYAACDPRNTPNTLEKQVLSFLVIFGKCYFQGTRKSYFWFSTLTEKRNLKAVSLKITFKRRNKLTGKYIKRSTNTIDNHWSPA